MNVIFSRAVAVVTGAVAYVILFILGPPILGILHSIFHGINSHESIVWRTVVTVTFVIINFTLYGLLGMAFGYIRPEVRWQWGLWLAIFPILADVLLLTAIGVMYPLSLILDVLAVIVGGCLGSQLGANFRQSKHLLSSNA